MHTLYPDSHGTLASVSTWKGIVMKISAANNCMGKSKAEVKPSNFWNPLIMRNTHWIPTNWTVHCGFIPEMWKHWVTPGNMRGKLSMGRNEEFIQEMCASTQYIWLLAAKSDFACVIGPCHAHGVGVGTPESVLADYYMLLNCTFIIHAIVVQM